MRVYKLFCLIFRIKFTVVSDPGENEEEDCVDVAHAFVDILKVRFIFETKFMFFIDNITMVL